MENYKAGKDATKILGVHSRTLYLWEKKGIIETIRTPGGKRLYNVKKFLETKQKEREIDTTNIDKIDDTQTNNTDKLNICYVRVSSNGQKSDLENQKSVMKSLYPNHTIIEDIGSGLNLNKKGIRKIVHLAIEGKINELVVAYRDRLTRFGFELIEELISKYSNGKIIILNEKDKIEPEEEIVKDIMSIMNVYVAKINGMRKYKKQEAINNDE